MLTKELYYDAADLPRKPTGYNLGNRGKKEILDKALNPCFGGIFYGLQWHLGGWGLAGWTGVRLAELLKMAGIKKNAVEVMLVGLDGPHWKRPMPVNKVMEQDTLLAYIMNGEILPPDHGFPLRALVSGWAGVSSVKWVNRIIVSTYPAKVPSNASKYLLIGPDYSPEPPARGPLVTNQVIKSACCLPWKAVLKRGHQKIFGYAWSLFGKIAQVDISLDGGKTFNPATLIGPNIEKAGTRWEFTFHQQPGGLTTIPWATDEKGNAQYGISYQKWNKRGYLFGAMVPHSVTVSARGCESYGQPPEAEIVISGCC
ncbi:molybdopterin-dependent oxidoreductase [Chloroflexota bacterium]